MRKLISTVMAATLAVTSLTAFAGTASARDWDRHDRNHRYERYDDNRHAYRKGYRHGQRNNNDGAAIAAGVIGLALGAAIVSSNQPTYGNSYDRACAAKYRTYDARSNTYLGVDGYRYRCQL